MTAGAEPPEGFKFLRRSAIDQHINARNRWDDLIPVIQKYPEPARHRPFRGHGDRRDGRQFEVMGKWKVAVHDNTRLYQPWEKPYYVLSPGDVYNMKTRKIEKFGNGVTPARRDTDGK